MSVDSKKTHARQSWAQVQLKGIEGCKMMRETHCSTSQPSECGSSRRAASDHYRNLVEIRNHGSGSRVC